MPKTIAFSEATEICGGNPITLWGEGAQHYTWNKGVKNSISFIPSQTSYYTVEGTNEKGCSKKDAIRITVNALPNMETNSIGSTITLTQEEALFQWINCDNMEVLANENQNYFSPKMKGLYAAVINKKGCIDTTDCFQIASLGIALNSDELAIHIYPNPNSGSFSIKAKNSGNYFITNNYGQIIQQFELNEQNNFSFYMEGLAAGVYYLKNKSFRDFPANKILIIP